jgi:ABC-2 type transport system ATP-binding protein
MTAGLPAALSDPSPGGAAAVEVRDLVKRYAGRAVVDGLSFDVPPGRIVALLGPNGAGKTTTVEIIEGYRRPDGGSVRVLGLDPVRQGRAVRSRIGIMLQGGGIPPLARPRETLELYGRFFRRPVPADELLRLVGLEEAASTRYRDLSGGQRQRLSLALALVGSPQLLILDEPTAGMDPAAKAATRELIGRLRDEGATILLTTHELADVERLADAVVIIDRGRIVAAGTPGDLVARARPRLRLRLTAALTEGDRRELEAILTADEVAAADPAGGSGQGLGQGGAASGAPRLADDGGGRYRLEGVRPTPPLIARLASWCAQRGLLLMELQTSGGSLEDVYLELTGDREALIEAVADGDGRQREPVSPTRSGKGRSTP